jgi:uncharacterized protein (TIGR03435 family)
MNRHKRNLDAVLDRHLSLFEATSRTKRIEETSMLVQLHAEASFREDQETFAFPQTTKVRWLRPVYVLPVAAIVILAVLAGLLNRTPPAVVEWTGGGSLRAGEPVRLGDIVRTGRNVGSVLKMADGSRIEMRPQSALSLESAADGVRIRLDTGGVIITAAKQRTGHLYVQTKDVTVSVVGTVFLVNTEAAGSRVAVIEGEVRVQQGASAKKILPGEQLATNPFMESHPIVEQISWSREAETHVATLQKLVTPKKSEFEVVSIRELPLSERSPGSSFVECRGVDGVWSYNKDVATQVKPVDVPLPPPVPQGRCIGSGLSQMLIAAAYGVSMGFVSGAENASWYYRLEAKAENPASATKEQLREMFQALVIDRFKLKAHRYTQERQGYALSVAKGGVKFKETSDEEELPRVQTRGPGVDTPLPFLLEMRFQGKLRMNTLAKVLSGGPTQGQPVLDRTGLSGVYDIGLLLHQVVRPVTAPRGGGGNGDASDMWDPPIAKAVEEQLGLRLESVGKVPVEYVEVDHVDKPSEGVLAMAPIPLGTPTPVYRVATLQAPPPPPTPLPIRIGGGGGVGGGGGAIPTTGSASIEGLVRRLDNSEPLPAALVTLLGLPDRTGALLQREAYTDASGKFVFEKLPPSTYTVRVTPNNFFAPTGTPTATASVPVTDGQKVSNVTFGLVPGGVIHGVIRDAGGRPQANLTARAMRVTYRDGRRILEPAKSVQSDDRGEFRLFYIPPGEYYVRADGRVTGDPVLGYYPGGREAASATVVRVRGGDEFTANLQVLSAKLFRISGTVVNPIPELADEPRGFVLMPRDLRFDDGTAAVVLPNLISNKPGSFEISALPGSYDLMPAGPIRAGAPIGAGNPHYYTGRVAVEVRDRDVEGVTVTITRGIDVSVQVNASAAPSLSLSNVRLGLRPVDALPSVLTNNNLGPGPLSADGKIEFRAVPEGKYALVIPGAAPGVSISDIRQGARSVLDQGVITVGKDGAEPIVVVLSSDGGRVEGSVEGADRTSATTRVSLVPEGTRRENLLLYKRAPLVEGRFTFTDVTPGLYRLFAWDDLPTGADENVEFMATYESRGRAVTVRSGAPVTDAVLSFIRR